jgi:hypothetical protein
MLRVIFLVINVIHIDIRILKDRSSSREKRDIAEAWLKENFDPEMWNAET